MITIATHFPKALFHCGSDVSNAALDRVRSGDLNENSAEREAQIAEGLEVSHPIVL